MFLVPAVLGIGALLAYGLAAYSRDHDRRELALMLLALYAGSMGLWYLGAVWAASALDWMLFCAAWVVADTRRAQWARSFLCICGIRMGAHCVQAVFIGQDMVAFAHVMNGCFAMQLWLVAGEGGRKLGDVFSCYLRDRMSGLRALLQTQKGGVARSG